MKEDECEYLRKLIVEWNVSRMDFFEISEFNEVSFFCIYWWLIYDYSLVNLYVVICVL